ncbi:hypothetical protein JD844_018097 [Phrynosoma platyrhinos]|uniref:thioredoxin-dependent peroxiredoxin n=1 Tax=Phrynosoma platyrhinos TaxID=52577 RepID=A0ABQ7SMX4_PHRPL|nr:hypothetical protein JD844_018097 [Phrynosoma platyrhinos]
MSAEHFLGGAGLGWVGLGKMSLTSQSLTSCNFLKLLSECHREMPTLGNQPQTSRPQRINTPKKQGGLGSMRIPLVSDTNRAIAKEFGVLKEDEGISYRGLFIIDEKGILRQITINDLPVGRSVDETLRLVQAFQFTDKYGEVCPAGWQPGADTIKPDVKQSKEYFSKQK